MLGPILLAAVAALLLGGGLTAAPLAQDATPTASGYVPHPDDCRVAPRSAEKTGG